MRGLVSAREWLGPLPPGPLLMHATQGPKEHVIVEPPRFAFDEPIEPFEPRGPRHLVAPHEFRVTASEPSPFERTDGAMLYAIAVDCRAQFIAIPSRELLDAADFPELVDVVDRDENRIQRHCCQRGIGRGL